MANPLPDNMITCAIGELLVQLRLLEYGIQAASPIKDSGNDLIGIKGREVRFIQVKTRSASNLSFSYDRLEDKIFDVLALVTLAGYEERIYLDKSQIILLRKDEWLAYRGERYEEDYHISKERVDFLWKG